MPFFGKGIDRPEQLIDGLCINASGQKRPEDIRIKDCPGTLRRTRILAEPISTSISEDSLTVTANAPCPARRTREKISR